MNKIEDITEKRNIKTITVDIFDTILLRNCWPEDLQFLEVAEKWLPYFKKEISEDITAQKLYYWRQYSRKEIIDAHYSYQPEKDSVYEYEYDTNLDEWFSGIVDSLQNLYGQKAAGNKKALVSRMIDIELETEIQHLTPNQKLINTIKEIKEKHPDIKVFFVSDMYLSGKQIAGLLNALEVDIFDNGISSSDVKYSKATGALFHYLEENDPFKVNFSICHNLHIGDNKVSDYKNPKRAGSYAININTTNRRKIKTNLGKAALGGLHAKSMRKTMKDVSALEKMDAESYRDFWRNYGALFSQPLYSFLFHIHFSRKYAADNTKFLMVSSEAALFSEIAKQNFSNLLEGSNLEVANKLNRRCIMRALLWAIIEKDIDVNAHPVLNTIFYGETPRTRYAIYRFVFGDDFPASELVINLRDEKEFFKALISDLKKQENRKYLSHLKAAYDYAIKFLPKKTNENIIITDVGWGGTVQVLYEAFAKLHGHTGSVRGLYLGTFPDPNRFAVEDLKQDAYLMPDVRCSKNRTLWNAVIWEYAYTNKIQFPGDKARLECMRNGMLDGVKMFQTATLAPKNYFDKIISKYIKRLVQKPTRFEVSLIGDIEFDFGFIEKTKYRIVDTSYSQLKFYQMLLLNPKSTIKNIIFKPNCWPTGYISYYRIAPLRWAIQIVGKLKKRYYL